MLAENADANTWYGVGNRNNPNPIFEYTQCFIWTKPTNANPGPLNQYADFVPVTINGIGADYTTARPSSTHTDGFNVVFCDGHTFFMANEIDYLVYARLMTPDGNGCYAQILRYEGKGVPNNEANNYYQFQTQPVDDAAIK